MPRIVSKLDLELAELPDFTTVCTRMQDLEMARWRVLLQLSADLHEPGEEVTISTTVTNNGSEEATYEIGLTVTNETVDTRNVTLGPGVATDIEFTETFAEPGEYQLAIGGEIVGTATIESAPDDGPGDDGGTPPSEDDGVADETGADEDCEVLGFDFGSFLVCWYWWLLAAALAVLLIAYRIWRRDGSPFETVNGDLLFLALQREDSHGTAPLGWDVYVL